MSGNRILFQPDPVPLPDDDKDYSDHKERQGRAIIDEIVHSKHEGTYN